jgi:hypothetical protein
MSLKRPVLEFGRDGIQLRALYRSEAKDGPNPGTKARRREVRALSVEGLTRALPALEDLGTSGFTTREDTFLCTTGRDAAARVHKKRAPTAKGART